MRLQNSVSFDNTLLVTVNQVSTSDDGPWLNNQAGMAESPCTHKRKMLERAENRPEGEGGGERHRPKRRQKKKSGCAFANSVNTDR